MVALRSVFHVASQVRVVKSSYDTGCVAQSKKLNNVLLDLRCSGGSQRGGKRIAQCGASLRDV